MLNDIIKVKVQSSPGNKIYYQDEEATPTVFIYLKHYRQPNLY